MISLTGSLPEVGDLIAGKYRLRGVLGRGGMGVVFDAHHELLDRAVALKVLAPEVSGNHEAVTRFMNEARAAAQIASDHVVHVLDVGTLESGLPYMVMERLEGIDLGQLVTRERLLGVADAVDLLVEAIEGVSHAHLEGIIHRDLKPSNLFLARRPDRTHVVKVLDFGISKLTGSGRTASGNMTATSAVLGSPYYMSPEQLRSSKSIDLRADVWSLGIIAYELLTRTLPFEGDNVVALFVAIQERDPRPLVELRSDLPPALDEAVRRCLCRSPEQRFSSAYAFGKALAPFGSPKARQSIERLEAYISSKGRSVDELCPTEPEPVALPGASIAPPRPFARTPPTLQSDARISAPGAPGSSRMAAYQPGSLAPVGPTRAASTNAPWMVTGARSSRPRMLGVSALAIVGTVAAGVFALGVVRTKLQAGHPSAGAGGERVEGSVMSTASASATVSFAAVDAAAPPSLALVEPPPASSTSAVASSTPPSTDGSHGHPIRAAHPVVRAATPSAPSPATSKSVPSPMNMNAL